MTPVIKPLFAATIPLGLISAPSMAFAQTKTSAETPKETSAAPLNPAQGQTVFPADYFTQYAPRTALDMINQVPGFSIRSGDLGKRGLGQGGANILINGERLTGKADPFAELQQILSANVEQIEILDGASLSIPGLSGQVANLTVKASKFGGSWQWNPVIREGLQPNLTNGRINISGETGDLTWSGFIRDFAFRGGVDGFETRRTAEGELFERRRLNVDNTGDRPGIGANLTWKPTEGHTANLNAEYALFNFNRKVDSIRTAVTDRGDNLQTQSLSSEDEVYFEIGVDYEMPFLGGTAKIIGYIEREDSPTRSTFSIFDDAGAFVEASRFEQDADEAETILRGEYSWAPKDGQSWQIGVEGAFNSLDVTQQFLTRGPSEDMFSGEDPTGFTVSEDRYEASLTHSRPLSPKWDLQTSIGVETSTLSQMRNGVAMSDERSFFRPKGFISATYKASPTFNIRSRVEREVGQLNFFDFIASVDLVDDLGREANPDLVPAQSWLGSIEFDKDFGQGNTAKLEVYGALIEDIVDRIPIGTDGDAVGNLDSAYRFGIEFNSTLKGEKWGLDGMLLETELEWRTSNVEDPLTGIDRRLSGDFTYGYEIGFRHDIPDTQWAYGAFAEHYSFAERFRSFTIGRSGNDNVLTGAYIEHKDILGLKARVQLVNLTGTTEFSRRTVFDGRRDGGVILREENGRYEFGKILQFRLSGEF